MLRRLTRPFWIVLAAVFLFEAWLWDKLTLLGHWLAERLPFDALKRWIAGQVERMPPWAALGLFIIPVVIVQPIKLFAIFLMVQGHIVFGALGFVAIKVVGFGAIAFLFDLTRDKLLSLRWFAWIYVRVNRLRAVAHDFVAPYKARVSQAMAMLRARASAVFGGFARRSRLSRIRSRMKGR